MFVYLGGWVVLDKALNVAHSPRFENMQTARRTEGPYGRTETYSNNMAQPPRYENAHTAKRSHGPYGQTHASQHMAQSQRFENIHPAEQQSYGPHGRTGTFPKMEQQPRFENNPTPQRTDGQYGQTHTSQNMAQSQHFGNTHTAQRTHGPYRRTNMSPKMAHTPRFENTHPAEQQSYGPYGNEMNMSPHYARQKPMITTTSTTQKPPATPNSQWRSRNTRTPFPGDKRGRCPGPIRTRRICSGNCRSDYDCRTRRKCCHDGSGKGCCTSPIFSYYQRMFNFYIDQENTT